MSEVGLIVLSEDRHLVIENCTSEQMEWFETDACTFDEDDVPEIVDKEEDCPPGEITGYVFAYHLQKYLDGKYTRCTFEEGKEIAEKFWGEWTTVNQLK